MYRHTILKGIIINISKLIICKLPNGFPFPSAPTGQNVLQARWYCGTKWKMAWHRTAPWCRCFSNAIIIISRNLSPQSRRRPFHTISWVSAAEEKFVLHQFQLTVVDGSVLCTEYDIIYFPLLLLFAGVNGKERTKRSSLPPPDKLMSYSPSSSMLPQPPLMSSATTATALLMQ